MSRRLLIVSLLPATFLAAPAYASVPYLQEQSAKEVGRAFSGGAASADDASTIFFNPAGMTELGQVNVSLNAHFLFVDSAQSNTVSTRTIPGVPTAVPISGNNGGNPFSQPIVVPTGYFSFRVNQSPVWLGLGISAPFGLKVKYADGFFGRYDSINSDLKTVDIQPSIAVRLNDHVSIGGGLDIQQIDVKLSNALPNVSPLLPDGLANVKGDGMTLGWNVGVLAKLGAWHFGASYRSRMKHDLNGSYQVSGLLGPLAGGNATLAAAGHVTLPDSAAVSAMYGAGKRFRVMATGKWFNWSQFKQIEIDPLGAPASISVQNYKDAWSGALGLEYDVTPKLTLRTGTLYDTTPTQDAYRTTRVPDGDRTWATAGATYRMTKNIEFNLSYAHIFVKSEPLNRVDTFYAGTLAQIVTTTNSTNSGSADEIATSVTFKL
jgi:long-chain fatty acid transport protein